MVKDVLRRAVGVSFAAILLLNSVACTSYSEPVEPVPTSIPLVTETPEDGPLVLSAVGEPSEADFSLTMLDVGQGLSILVQADGEYLLYDGGARGASSYVVAYLQQHDVTELAWLVASHYDEDHISGLVGVLHTTPVEQALMPDYTTDTQIYQSLQNVLGEKSVPVFYPEQGDVFSLGNAEIQIVGPKNYDYASDNNNSICLRIEYGDFRCLLTGDAEQEAEQDKEIKQMLFPGAPCVFYGDEAGLTGVTEPEYRRPMDWENAEGSWFDFYRQVAGLRAKYLNGTERFTVLAAAPQSCLFGYALEREGLCLTVWLNAGDTPCPLPEAKEAERLWEQNASHEALGPWGFRVCRQARRPAVLSN